MTFHSWWNLRNIMHQASLLLRIIGAVHCPFLFPGHSSSTTARDPWNAVISESQGQNRICSRRSHEASSSRLLNYFPLSENYSWAISILAEILALPVSLLRFPTLFIFLLPSPLLLFISLTNVVSRVISSYCL